MTLRAGPQKSWSPTPRAGCPREPPGGGSASTGPTRGLDVVPTASARLAAGPSASQKAVYEAPAALPCVHPASHVRKRRVHGQGLSGVLAHVQTPGRGRSATSRPRLLRQQDGEPRAPPVLALAEAPSLDACSCQLLDNCIFLLLPGLLHEALRCPAALRPHCPGKCPATQPSAPSWQRRPLQAPRAQPPSLVWRPGLSAGWTVPPRLGCAVPAAPQPRLWLPSKTGQSGSPTARALPPPGAEGGGDAEPPVLRGPGTGDGHKQEDPQGLGCSAGEPSAGPLLVSGHQDGGDIRPPPRAGPLTLGRTPGSGWTSPQALELHTGRTRGRHGDHSTLPPQGPLTDDCPEAQVHPCLWPQHGHGSPGPRELSGLLVLKPGLASNQPGRPGTRPPPPTSRLWTPLCSSGPWGRGYPWAPGTRHAGGCLGSVPTSAPGPRPS